MRFFTGAASCCLLATGPPSLADEKEARAVIDKAIKAMGGEEKLSDIKAFSARGNGTITVDGTDIDFALELATQGVER